jgi:hypothetical protein
LKSVQKILLRQLLPAEAAVILSLESLPAEPDAMLTSLVKRRWIAVTANGLCLTEETRELLEAIRKDADHWSELTEEERGGVR